MKKTITMLNKELAELRNSKFESQSEPEIEVKEAYDVKIENMKLLDQVEKLEKENGHLNVKCNDIELLYEKTDRELRDRDIWVEDMVEEIRNELRRKEQEWIKQNEDIKRYQAEEILRIQTETFNKENSSKKELLFCIERAQEKEKELRKEYKELQDNTLE